MAEHKNQAPARAQRNGGAGLAPPEWYCRLALAAAFLLPLARLDGAGGSWRFPILSVGEWLLLPLGLVSLSLGILSPPRLRERTLLPLWLSAIVPAVLWMAGQGLAMLRAGFTPDSGDLIVAWIARLIFPTLVFLPLLADRIWRDRLLWTLAIGAAVNILAVIWLTRAAGLAVGDPLRLDIGGFLVNHHDYGLFLALLLPMLSAWRGGERKTRRSLAILFCMFLLPALALAACQTWSGLVAVSAGLAVSWAAWRGHAWILGCFILLAAFGYGAADRRDADRARRGLIAASTGTAAKRNEEALEAFVARPFFGRGPAAFAAGAPAGAAAGPWYATLLDGSGLVGFGLWIVLLAELAARALGRDGGRDAAAAGGILGAATGLAVACLWTEALPPGAGALVGLLLAFSAIPPGHDSPRT